MHNVDKNIYSDVYSVVIKKYRTDDKIEIEFFKKSSILFSSRIYLPNNVFRFGVYDLSDKVAKIIDNLFENIRQLVLKYKLKLGEFEIMTKNLSYLLLHYVNKI